MREKYADLFSPMEVDAIGEIMNISIGSSATAISTLLDRRVDITTPHVDVLSFDEFEFSELEPAVGVEITYVEGLDGKNVMVLKKNDLRNILQILLQTEISEDDFVMDEMANSAICEIMNQMMGVSSTALSEFLGERVNISTPVSFEIENSEDFKKQYFTTGEPMVKISFKLSIEDCMESEFMTMMSIALAKRITASAGFDDSEVFIDPVPALPEEAEATYEPYPTPGASLSQDAIEKLIASTQAEAQPAPQAAAQVPPVQGAQQIPPQMQVPPQMPPQQMPPQGMPPQGVPPYDYYGGQPPYPYPPYGQPPYPGYAPEYQQQPKVIHVDPVKQFNLKDSNLEDSQGSNLEMLMSVPLQLSVEIGRAKRTVKEIIDFSAGSLVVLDKLAGDHADVYVNGQLVAKGDVVVVDDCFGVRITEIMTDKDFLLKK